MLKGNSGWEMRTINSAYGRELSRRYEVGLKQKYPPPHLPGKRTVCSESNSLSVLKNILKISQVDVHIGIRCQLGLILVPDMGHNVKVSLSLLRNIFFFKKKKQGTLLLSRFTKWAGVVGDCYLIIYVFKKRKSLFSWNNSAAIAWAFPRAMIMD